MLGVHRLRVSALLGLRDFLARVLVDDEAVRDHGLVGARAVQRDARHERRLEPAAMLVGRFEINVRRAAAEFGARLHHGGAKRRSRSRHRACRCGASCRRAGRASAPTPRRSSQTRNSCRGSRRDRRPCARARHRRSACRRHHRKPAAARPRCAGARCTSRAATRRCRKCGCGPSAEATSRCRSPRARRRGWRRCLMKNCSTARKMIGVFERQQYGYEC